MFDTTTIENSLDPSSLISSDIFSNATSQPQLFFDTNSDLDAVSSDPWDGKTILPQSQINNAETALTSQSVDPLTGMTVDDALAGNASGVLSTASDPSVQRIVGDFRANQFTIPYAGYTYVLSGNGNIDYGSGYRDYIDLNSISQATVGFNLANTAGGGVVYDPGNGVRVFDVMYLSDGTQILFEGIDSILFNEGLVELSVQPNDPYFNYQWNLHMMGVQNAWRFSTGSSGVMIGVEDTGLGVDAYGSVHPDLRSTTIYPENYADEFTEIEISHGAAVQSIIAAATNNGSGISGINWSSPVFNIDVLVGEYNDRDIAQATQNTIDFANSYGEKLIINMSLGYTQSAYFEQLVANNRDNALFVIASGNDDRDSLSYPAWLAYYYDNVIAVGASWSTYNDYGYATNPGDRISYPGVWGSNYGVGLTVMGPSEVPAAAAYGSPYGSTYLFDYAMRFGGTSAATPNVAGVASLVWSANSNLSAPQIKAILAQTAVDLGTSGYDYTYGYGFVNADAAVRQAMAFARMGYTASPSSASPFVSALGGYSLAVNAALNASNIAVQPVWLADTDGTNPVIPSIDFSKSDRASLTLSISVPIDLPTNSDRTDVISSLFTSDRHYISSQAPRFLGDGLNADSLVGINSKLRV